MKIKDKNELMDTACTTVDSKWPYKTAPNNQSITTLIGEIEYSVGDIVLYPSVDWRQESLKKLGTLLSANPAAIAQALLVSVIQSLEESLTLREAKLGNTPKILDAIVKELQKYTNILSTVKNQEIIKDYMYQITYDKDNNVQKEQNCFNSISELLRISKDKVYAAVCAAMSANSVSEELVKVKRQWKDHPAVHINPDADLRNKIINHIGTQPLQRISVAEYQKLCRSMGEEEGGKAPHAAWVTKNKHLIEMITVGNQKYYKLTKVGKRVHAHLQERSTANEEEAAVDYDKAWASLSTQQKQYFLYKHELQSNASNANKPFADLSDDVKGKFKTYYDSRQKPTTENKQTKIKEAADPGRPINWPKLQDIFGLSDDELQKVVSEIDKEHGDGNLDLFDTKAVIKGLATAFDNAGILFDYDKLTGFINNTNESEASDSADSITSGIPKVTNHDSLLKAIEYCNEYFALKDLAAELQTLVDTNNSHDSGQEDAKLMADEANKAISDYISTNLDKIISSLEEAKENHLEGVNMVDMLMDKFGKQIKEYGITEIFIADGEVHTTSNYDIPADTIEKIESYFKTDEEILLGPKKKEKDRVGGIAFHPPYFNDTDAPPGEQGAQLSEDSTHLPLASGKDDSGPYEVMFSKTDNKFIKRKDGKDEPINDFDPSKYGLSDSVKSMIMQTGVPACEGLQPLEKEPNYHDFNFLSKHGKNLTAKVGQYDMFYAETQDGIGDVWLINLKTDELWIHTTTTEEIANALAEYLASKGDALPATLKELRDFINTENPDEITFI